IVAVFVLKSTVQHENLLASAVRVAGKSTPGRIAQHRGGADAPPPDAAQHAPGGARRGARHPIQLRGVDDDGFQQIVVNAHGPAPSWSNAYAARGARGSPARWHRTPQAPSTTLADLFTPRRIADPLLTMRASLRRWSSEEL